MIKLLVNSNKGQVSEKNTNFESKVEQSAAFGKRPKKNTPQQG